MSISDLVIELAEQEMAINGFLQSDLENHNDDEEGFRKNEHYSLFELDRRRELLLKELDIIYKKESAYYNNIAYFEAEIPL